LIVCEGENTEPSYFRQFKLSSAGIEAVGVGYNTISLVRRAIALSKAKQYDQVWCVFDADPKPDNQSQSTNFNEAIKLADQEGFGLAYSNQAFEYWLILHFNDHQGGKLNRGEYSKKINDFLKPYGLIYQGKASKFITRDMFNLFLDPDPKTGVARIALAIKRAKRNYDRLEHSNPSAEESSTTVFRLVEEIMKHI
jgi:hypothetical protein